MALKQDQVRAFYTSHGYSQDRHGHLTRVTATVGPHSIDTKTRIKITHCSVRKERQVKIGGKNEWVRVASGYLKDLFITPDNKLLGLSRNGCGAPSK